MCFNKRNNAWTKGQWRLLTAERALSRIKISVRLIVLCECNQTKKGKVVCLYQQSLRECYIDVITLPLFVFYSHVHQTKNSTENKYIICFFVSFKTRGFNYTKHPKCSGYMFCFNCPWMDSENDKNLRKLYLIAALRINKRLTILQVWWPTPSRRHTFVHFIHVLHHLLET